jgi:hypothetical protein
MTALLERQAEDPETGSAWWWAFAIAAIHWDVSRAVPPAAPSPEVVMNWSWVPEIATIHSTVSRSVPPALPQSRDQRDVLTFTVLLEQFDIDPEWTLEALKRTELTIGNIWLPSYIQHKTPGQELLSKLVLSWKAEEVMELIKGLPLTEPLWKFLPLLTTLVENGKAQEVWSILATMDFAKEGKWWFGSHYLSLLRAIESKIPYVESLEGALRNLDIRSL